MIKGLHHACISVTNLERSIEFYCNLLGMELLQKSAFGDVVMDRITKLTDASGRGAMLRVGRQHLELFEFETPAPSSHSLARRACDYGISHFCLEVDDLTQEYARLAAAGVEFHCPPQAFGKMLSTYARDPDGIVFELLEISDERL